jgi:hypothetical protein
MGWWYNLTFTVILLLPQVGFVKPVEQDFAVQFIGFRKWNPQMRKFLDAVDETIDKLHSEGGNRTVLSLFTINMLCGESCSQCQMVAHHSSSTLPWLACPPLRSFAECTHSATPNPLAVFLGLLVPENGDTKILQNVRTQTIWLRAWCHVPEDLSPQHHHCETLRYAGYIDEFRFCGPFVL